jgi:hypothetical protein
MSRRPKSASAAAALALLALGVSALAAPANAPGAWHPNNVVVLAPPAEPDAPLEISGRVVSTLDSLPVPGVRVHAYHADASGQYIGRRGGPIHLAGDFTSGPGGLYRVRTILPGRAEGAPHVHFEVLDEHGGRTMVTLDLCRIHGAGSDSTYEKLPYFPSLPPTDRSLHYGAVEPGAEHGYVVRWNIPVAIRAPHRER